MRLQSSKGRCQDDCRCMPARTRTSETQASWKQPLWPGWRSTVDCTVSSLPTIENDNWKNIKSQVHRNHPHPSPFSHFYFTGTKTGDVRTRSRDWEFNCIVPPNRIVALDTNFSMNGRFDVQTFRRTDVPGRGRWVNKYGFHSKLGKLKGQRKKKAQYSETFNKSETFAVETNKIRNMFFFIPTRCFEGGKHLEGCYFNASTAYVFFAQGQASLGIIRNAQ